jgi:hypothetical protein
MFDSPYAWSISVSSRPTTVLRLHVPTSAPATGRAGAVPVRTLAHRFRAEFTSGPLAGLAADGHLNGDAAIGALVRLAAAKCKTRDEVVDLLARVLDRPAQRTADETIGRMVRCAAASPKRRNAGVRVHFANPEARPQLKLHSAPERGGAA